MTAMPMYVGTSHGEGPKSGGAIRRDAEHGVVLIDETKCIACAMCAMVCPFDVITYYPIAGSGPDRAVAVKCDGCIERLRADSIPACVEACKVGALEFGELNTLVGSGRQRAGRVPEPDPVRCRRRSELPFGLP